MTLALLLLVFLVILLWYETFKIREFVLLKCRQTCQESGLQLLDQTIALATLSLKRTPDGLVNIYRCYGFEYSTNGTDRLRGYVDLLGRKIVSVRLEDAEGKTVYFH